MQGRKHWGDLGGSEQLTPIKAKLFTASDPVISPYIKVFKNPLNRGRVIREWVMILL